MNYAIHRISLDVTDDSPSQLTIAAKQGDTAKLLIVSLLDDKKNYQIAEGSVAVFIAKKSTGKWLEHPCTIDRTNNKVIYTFQEETVSVAGTLECEIHLTFSTTVTKDDGTVELVTEDLTTASFVIVVHDTILSGITDDTEEASLLPDLITKATGLFTTIEQQTVPKAENATAEALGAVERAENALAEAITANEQASQAIENINNIIDEVETKLENGDFKGEKGDQGIQGIQGIQGEKGEQGEKGDSVSIPLVRLI